MSGNALAGVPVGAVVVDLVRAILIVAAVVASARARYLGGIVITVAVSAVFVIEIVLPIRYPLRPAAIEIAMGAVFLGPTALPHLPPFAACKLFMDPTHHVATALAAAFGARTAFRRAAMLPPDGEASRAWDRAGLRFVALGVVLGLMSIAGLLAHLIGDES